MTPIESGESGIASPGHYTKDLSFNLLGTSPNRKGIETLLSRPAPPVMAFLLQISVDLKTKELMLAKCTQLM